jgi:hypothetical protein
VLSFIFLIGTAAFYGMPCLKKYFGFKYESGENQLYPAPYNPLISSVENSLPAVIRTFYSLNFPFKKSSKKLRIFF